MPTATRLEQWPGIRWVHVHCIVCSQSRRRDRCSIIIMAVLLWLSPSRIHVHVHVHVAGHYYWVERLAYRWSSPCPCCTPLISASSSVRAKQQAQHLRDLPLHPACPLETSTHEFPRGSHRPYPPPMPHLTSCTSPMTIPTRRICLPHPSPISPPPPIPPCLPYLTV